MVRFWLVLMAEQSASIRLSGEHKGRKRREPVWIGRYRIVGKDSAKVLGKAWTKRSRAPDGRMTRSQAEEASRRLLLTWERLTEARAHPRSPTPALVLRELV